MVITTPLDANYSSLGREETGKKMKHYIKYFGLFTLIKLVSMAIFGGIVNKIKNK